METDITQAIGVMIQHYGILAVFIFSLIEEIIAPIPSSLVLLGAGFFLLPSEYSFLATLPEVITRIMLPASIGLTIGATLVYSLAYGGGKVIITRWGKWVGISWERIEKEEQRFIEGNKDEFTLFGLRALPIMPSFLLSVISGIVRYPVKKFIIITFLGSLVRSFMMGLMGWWAGEAYLAYADRLSKIGSDIAWGVGIMVIVIALIFFIKTRLRR